MIPLTAEEHAMNRLGQEVARAQIEPAERTRECDSILTALKALLIDGVYRGPHYPTDRLLANVAALVEGLRWHRDADEAPGDPGGGWCAEHPWRFQRETPDRPDGCAICEAELAVQERDEARADLALLAEIPGLFADILPVSGEGTTRERIEALVSRAITDRKDARLACAAAEDALADLEASGEPAELRALLAMAEAGEAKAIAERDRLRGEVPQIVAWLRSEAGKTPAAHECSGYDEGQNCCGDAFADAIERGAHRGATP